MVVNLGIGYSICTTGITITEVAHYVMVCILGCVGKLDSCSRLLWANRILRGLLWTPGLGLKTQSLNWNHFMLKIFRISPCRATATAVCFMNRKSCHFALCFVYRIGLPCPTNYASSISEGPLSHLIFLTLSILYILLCVCCLRRSSTKRG